MAVAGDDFSGDFFFDAGVAFDLGPALDLGPGLAFGVAFGGGSGFFCVASFWDFVCSGAASLSLSLRVTSKTRADMVTFSIQIKLKKAKQFGKKGKLGLQNFVSRDSSVCVGEKVGP